jgi:hypothetical protein
MFYEGRIGAFGFLILICVISYYRIKRVEGGETPNIRSLPALDAVEEAVGRAAEMGRPVFSNSGYAAGGLTTIEAPIIGAAMSLLYNTARLTAKYGVKLVHFLGPINIVPVAEDVIKSAYITEGVAEDYDPTMVRWLSDFQFVYVSGFMGACQREHPATHIMMGGFWYESILIGEAGRAAGAFTVGGTPRQGQIYFLVAVCDYVLIGDEYYAAAAKVSQDPLEIGTIWGADDIKTILIGLLIFGSVLGIMGINFISSLLST